MPGTVASYRSEQEYSTVKRIGLVGTGNIADAHAAALRTMAGLEITAVVDVVRERAKRFARKRSIAHVFANVDELIAAKIVDVAHVLVPPALHRLVAETLLRAGIHSLVEKPLATSGEECDALMAAAAAGGAALQVNHNFVFHPAHLAAKRHLADGRFGGIRHVIVHLNLPLRQLAARQLSHWMFDEPKNLLLEQAVHPLSQIDDLIGPTHELTVLAAPPTILAEGQSVSRRWDISLRGEQATAQLHVALGESFPSWGMLVICDDGQITIDYVNNRVTFTTSTKWPDFVDSFLGGSTAACQLAAQSLRNLNAHGLSLVKLRPRADPFFRSIEASIQSFYETLERDRKSLTGISGRRIVETCVRIAQTAHGAASDLRPRPAEKPEAVFDVAVLGGTGFIGLHLVVRLLRDGKRVAVMARGLRNLPVLYDDPRIGLFPGDITRRDDVLEIVRRARQVVNLAHGGGSGNWDDIERALVGGARTVAECCLSAGIERLVHVSTIAALYLGDDGPITDTTPVDPLSTQRGDYARAKADAERALLALHREHGLPVCILRPGVVIGAGGIAVHSGVGFYNGEKHVLGWNDGSNPLPLVLAADVADAIARALDADGVVGHCYNIVGDVRLTAREYVDALRHTLGRPLRYYPQSVAKLFAIELVKWSVKRVTGRPGLTPPSLRDLRSRGLRAQFDCADAKRDLGWQPTADRSRFVAEGIAVHAPK
jgi:predicted dehydrogenase/nucleoside-diphosphate-sugar epimerase